MDNFDTNFIGLLSVMAEADNLIIFNFPENKTNGHYC